MKLTIEQKTLLNALKITKDICEKKPIQPILSSVKIETVEGGVRIYATNLQESVVTPADAYVDEKGSICVNADKLYEIVNCLSNDINLETTDCYLKIQSGNAKFKLLCCNVEEFPQTNFINDGDILTLDAKEFKKRIKNVLFSTADEAKNLLSGVHFKSEGTELKLYSTDGNRLSVEKLECSQSNVNVIVPKNILNAICRNDFEEVEVIANDKNITFMIDKTIYKSTVLNGTFPDVEKIIPHYTNYAILDRTQCLKALERVSVMINDLSNIVKLTFKDGLLTLKGNTQETGNAEDIIEAECNVEEFKVAFNYRYLLDYLKTTTQDVIKFEFNNPLGATVFNGDFLHLLMPVQIR